DVRGRRVGRGINCVRSVDKGRIGFRNCSVLHCAVVIWWNARTGDEQQWPWVELHFLISFSISAALYSRASAPITNGLSLHRQPPFVAMPRGLTKRQLLSPQPRYWAQVSSASSTGVMASRRRARGTWDRGIRNSPDSSTATARAAGVGRTYG